MSEEPSLAQIQQDWHGSLKAYVIGFVFSLLFTALAFFFVFQRLLPTPWLIYVIIGLALLQAITQVIFFLHVGAEGKPHWQTITFLFMTLVLLIIAVGSIWVMNDLNDRMMPEMTTMEHSHD